MIAACPTCSARYRIDVTKLRPEGARLRCSRCETVFRVRAPAESVVAPEPEVATPAPAPPEPVVASPPAPATPVVSTPAQAEITTPEPTAVPEPQRDSSRLVLVATPEPDAGKAAATAISSWGLETLLVHDGVEAMLNIQRALPRVVVLDAALPKMFGFQVCEIVKRNESLRSIHVVLVGAIHDRDRYRRPPGELYGADVYVERHELPDGLLPVLRDAGLPAVEPAGVARPPAPAPIAPATPKAELTPPMPRPAFEEASPDPFGGFVEAAPESAVAPTPMAPESAVAPTPMAPEPAVAPAPMAPEPAVAPAPMASEPAVAPAPVDPELGAEVAKAERLARIIVSDIVLYNQAKFDAALRTGNVVEALASELEEGHSLFAQRVDPRVGDAQDLLSRELLRLARSRGMK